MGQMALEEATAWRVDGYPIEYTMYYLYCDRCGSFDIAPHVSIAAGIAAVVTTVCAGTLLYELIAFTRLAETAGLWWMLFALATMLVLIKAWHSVGHRCRACGNRQISYDNVLGYGEQEYLQGIRSLSRERIHSHNEPGGGWPAVDVKMIVLFPAVMIYMSLMPVIILAGAAITWVYEQFRPVKEQH